MQNIWNLIEAALGVNELHSMAVDARKDLAIIKLKFDEVTREGPDYVPQEYPKMVNGQTVYTADEETAAGGTPVTPTPVAPTVDPVSDPVTTPTVTEEDPGYTGSTP